MCICCSDSVTNENKASTVSAVDGNVSASQPSSGYQPVWVGVPGKKSLADIVKMGRPQTKASSASKSSHNSANHHLTYAPPSSELYHDLSSSEDHGSKVSNLYTEPGAVSDEWPLIDPPQAASMSSVLESHTDSQLHPDQSNLPYDKFNQHTHSDTDEVEAEEDSSIEDLSANHVSSVTVSSRNMQEDKSGDPSLFDNDMYNTNMGSYQSHNHAFQNEEGEYFSFIPAITYLTYLRFSL